ncbi:hypothetical protein GCM10009798_01830 [Nocardioides panacihumi]|uniref:Uncharacterized protein n=1 Tax=Nocardioides panacihumi TaxID=400774 RepID=A0ABP5BJC3_9ACTN
MATVVALVLVVAAVVGVVWWRGAHRDGFATALTLVPDDAQRYSWTDWAGVRRALHVPDAEDPSGAAVDAFLSRGFDADLTSASAMVTSADALQSHLGFSPATVTWEMFAQSDSGAVVVVQPTSTDGVEAALARAGYTRGPHGIWGGADAAARLGITPEFGNIAVHDGRVYASDSADYLDEVLGGGFTPADPVSQVAGNLGDPVSAIVYSGDYVCGHLAMSQADDVDQAQAAELIRQAGGVDPLTAFAMGVDADRQVRVALGFENHDQAVHDADARAVLAGGPAPGQGGSFTDRFRLGRVAADGGVVTMQLHPVRGAYVLSDLSTGPVLFASC